MHDDDQYVLLRPEPQQREAVERTAAQVERRARELFDDRFEDDPALAALYQEYLTRMEGEVQSILEAIPQEEPPSGGAYVGVAGCRDCHVEQTEFWSTTKHAVAFDSLIEVNHDYVPSCISCHSTGFGFVGGFLLPSETPALAGVQCESCHGAGGDYWKMNVMKDREASVAAGLVIPDESTCVTCHNDKSPTFKGFDFATASAAIAHPNPKTAK